MLGPTPNSTVIFETILGLRNEPAGEKAWSVISHFPFVILAVLGAYLGSKITFAIALVVLLSSEVYHICISYNVCMGLTELQTWSNDRFTAPLSLLLVTYYLITWHDLDVAPQDLSALDDETRARLSVFNSYNSELLDQDGDGLLGARFNPPMYYLRWQELWLVFAFSIYAMVSYTWPRGDLYPTHVMLVLCLLGWLFYALLRNERDVDVGADRFMLGPTRPHWPMLILGIACGAIGVGLYLVPETTSSLAHSFWHMFAGFALIFIFLSKVMRPVSPLYVVEYQWPHKRRRQRLIRTRTPRS